MKTILHERVATMINATAILIVFFGATDNRTTISEQFETVELCEAAYTAIKEKYGTYSGNFSSYGHFVRPEDSGCVEIK
jgi:hypothetical protein